MATIFLGAPDICIPFLFASPTLRFFLHCLCSPSCSLFFLTTTPQPSQSKSTTEVIFLSLSPLLYAMWLFMAFLWAVCPLANALPSPWMILYVLLDQPNPFFFIFKYGEFQGRSSSSLKPPDKEREEPERLFFLLFL